MLTRSLLPWAALPLACAGGAVPDPSASPASLPPPPVTTTAPAEPELAKLPDGHVPMAFGDGVLLARRGFELSWWRHDQRVASTLLREIDWLRARVATRSEEAWIATWAEAGGGPLTVRHITPQGETSAVPAVDAAGCAAEHTACDVSIRTLVAGEGGPWLGGWLGVHSNEVAFKGLVLQPSSGRSWSLTGPSEGPAFETTVDALLADSGRTWVVGHYQDPALHPSGREGLWWARIDHKTGEFTGPTALPGSDASWSGASPALAAHAGGLRIALRGEDTVRSLVLDGSGEITSDQRLTLPHPGRAIWLAIAADGSIGLATRGILHRLHAGELQTWITPDNGFISVIGWHDGRLMAAGRYPETFVLGW